MNNWGIFNLPYKAQEFQSSKFSTYPLGRSASYTSKGVHILPEAILKTGADFHHIQPLWRALLRVYIPLQVRVKTSKEEEFDSNHSKYHLIQ